MISRELLDWLRGRFALSLTGIHGAPHWARVRRNALLLAALTPGASRRVAEHFAVLHDSCRRAEDGDPDHGRRASELISSMPSDLLPLQAGELSLLRYACEHHSKGWLEADPTVQVCWDADRLDLGRVGVRPLPRYLCTAAARDPAFLEEAYLRSLPRAAPAPASPRSPEEELGQDEPAPEAVPIRLYHASRERHEPGAILGPFGRNHFSSSLASSRRYLEFEACFERWRPADRPSRLAACYAFDTPQACRSFWLGQQRRGWAKRRYEPSPHYYEVVAAPAFPAAYALTNHVFRLQEAGLPADGAAREYWCPRQPWSVLEYLSATLTVRERIDEPRADASHDGRTSRDDALARRLWPLPVPDERRPG